MHTRRREEAVGLLMDGGTSSSSSGCSKSVELVPVPVPAVQWREHATVVGVVGVQGHGVLLAVQLWTEPGPSSEMACHGWSGVWLACWEGVFSSPLK